MAGAIADHISTAQSYVIPFAGYVIMAMYAMYVPFCPLLRAGRLLLRPRRLAGSNILTPYLLHSGMVISQTRSGGFRVRTVDEIAQKRAELQTTGMVGRRESDSDIIDKKGSQEFVETV